jgi:hypothetical protein
MVCAAAGGAFIDDTLQLGNTQALSTYIFGSRRSQRSLPAAQGGFGTPEEGRLLVYRLISSPASQSTATRRQGNISIMRYFVMLHGRLCRLRGGGR